MRARLLPWGAVGWLCGVGMGSVLVFSFHILLAFFLSILFLLVFVPRTFLVCLSGILFLLGSLWAQRAVLEDHHIHSQWESFFQRPVTLTGSIEQTEERGSAVRIRVGSVTVNNHPLPGFVDVRFPYTNALTEHAFVRMSGVLKPTTFETTTDEPGSFDFERYFTRFRVFARLEKPQLQEEKRAIPSSLSRLRTTLHGHIRESVPEPEAGLLSALLLSYDRDLSAPLRDALAISGITHLIAISGSHIAVFAAAIFFLCTVLGFSRTYSALITLLSAVCFLGMVEWPASGVRSLLMIGIVYWGYAAGRRFQALRALLLSAVLMTLQNPRILLADLGFQLSFLALWGLLVLAPLLDRFLPFAGKGGYIRTTILLTFAADIATSPLIAYSFGRFSLIGVLTNLLAIPLFVPLLCVAAIAAFGGGIPFLQPLIALGATYPASFFLWIATMGASLPGAGISVPNFSFRRLLFFYAVLFSVPFLCSLHTHFMFKHLALFRGLFKQTSR